MFIRKRAGRTAKRSKTSSDGKTTSARKKTQKVTVDEFFSMVQEKAYELYLKRGCGHGDDQTDWYRAEQEVEKGVKVA